MQRLENLGFKAGYTAEQLMDHAAEAVVSVICNWFELSKAPHTVVLLVGKGNNGGDALTIGTFLLKQKYRVYAKLVYPIDELSSLCKARLEQFKKAGGSLYSSES